MSKPSIWVDADACPRVIREILCRVADRAQVQVTFVANQKVPLPGSKFLRALQVSSGFDVADNAIVERVNAGDLVITGDIPLAAEVLEKEAHALSPRGERFTRENIGQRLNMRDFMETMRASGIQHGGPPPLDQGDRQAFANALDRLVAQWQKANRSD